MNDYSEICTALQRQLRTIFEKANQKNFKEAIDDPGAVDMGVGGVLGGASNKEPMSSNKDNLITTEITKKKKKQEK